MGVHRVCAAEEGGLFRTENTLWLRSKISGIGAARGCFLPCALIDQAFDTEFLGIVAQAILGAFACALMLSVRTIRIW